MWSESVRISSVEAAVRMERAIRDSSALDEAIRQHQHRNEALVARLMELGVALHEPRPIDLHFFAPDLSAAHELARSLRASGLGLVDLAEPGPDGRVSVEAHVIASVSSVVAEPFIGLLVRTAMCARSVHDGWGTSVPGGLGPS